MNSCEETAGVAMGTCRVARPTWDACEVVPASVAPGGVGGMESTTSCMTGPMLEDPSPILNIGDGWNNKWQ